MGLEGCPGFIVLVPPGPSVFWILSYLSHQSVCNTNYLRLRDWLAGCGCEVRSLFGPLYEALERLLIVVGYLESFVVCCHVRRVAAGVVLVEVVNEVHGGPCRVFGVLVFQSRQVRVVKYHKQLVLQGQVEIPVIVVHTSLLHVISDYPILLCGLRT